VQNFIDGQQLGASTTEQVPNTPPVQTRTPPTLQSENVPPQGVVEPSQHCAAPATVQQSPLMQPLLAHSAFNAQIAPLTFLGWHTPLGSQKLFPVQTCVALQASRQVVVVAHW
jgi:hypothetical protein